MRKRTHQVEKICSVNGLYCYKRWKNHFSLKHLAFAPHSYYCSKIRHLLYLIDPVALAMTPGNDLHAGG